MLCQYSLFSTVISFVYKDKGGDSYFLFHALTVFFISTVITFVYKDTKTNRGSMKACQLSSVWKILEKELKIKQNVPVSCRLIKIL